MAEKRFGVAWETETWFFSTAGQGRGRPMRAAPGRAVDLGRGCTLHPQERDVDQGLVLGKTEGFQDLRKGSAGSSPNSIDVSINTEAR